jgi:hypothetical protein
MIFIYLLIFLFQSENDENFQNAEMSDQLIMLVSYVCVSLNRRIKCVGLIEYFQSHFTIFKFIPHPIHHDGAIYTQAKAASIERKKDESMGSMNGKY